MEGEVSRGARTGRLWAAGGLPVWGRLGSTNHLMQPQCCCPGSSVGQCAQAREGFSWDGRDGLVPEFSQPALPISRGTRVVFFPVLSEPNQSSAASALPPELPRSTGACVQPVPHLHSQSKPGSGPQHTGWCQRWRSSCEHLLLPPTVSSPSGLRCCCKCPDQGCGSWASLGSCGPLELLVPLDSPSAQPSPKAVGWVLDGKVVVSQAMAEIATGSRILDDLSRETDKTNIRVCMWHVPGCSKN